MMRRTTWLWRGIALIPAFLLSTWWTVSLVDDDEPAAVRSTVPDGVPVLDAPYDGPASWSEPRPVGRGVLRGTGDRIVASASVHGIPTAALAAYRRADVVINAADRSCDLPWELIAAIGRVESDHGRYGGNTLGTDGLSRPGIYGIPLDGRRGTAVIRDTDAGQWDRDKVHDRAVGPMQFIPSTWSDVGVDADGDGERNPQDVDDAALAAAVYLCGGKDSLSGEAGQRAALYRYNHSKEYVDLVLAIMDAYTDGDYASVPTNSISAVTFTVDSSSAKPVVRNAGKHEGAMPGAGAGTGGGQTATPPNTSFEPQPQPKPPAPPPGPRPEPSGNDPVHQLEETVQKTVKDTTRTVSTVLSLPQAILKCTSLGYNAILTPTQWNACIAEQTH